MIPSFLAEHSAHVGTVFDIQQSCVAAGNDVRTCPQHVNDCAPWRTFHCVVWLLLFGSAQLWAAGDASAPVETFDVLHIAVTGNSVLTPTVVEELVYPFMGQARSIADVEAARQALEQAYHQAGYQTVLVDIPEQDVSGGIVRLAVTEGRIEFLQVSGSRYFSLGRIRAAVPSLASGAVPRMTAVATELDALALKSRDRTVTPILRAGRRPGTVAAELRVKDSLPLHGSVEINSRSSVNTSAMRIIGSLRYDNLWQRYHSASLQYQTAPLERDVEVWAGTYLLPLGESDWRLALYGIGISSESPVAASGALAVVGTGTIFGGRLMRTLPTIGPVSHSLSLGVDYKDFAQSIVLVGADTQDTPISYLPFNARYDANWQHGTHGRTWFGAELDFSVRGLGNDQQEFEDKRFLARSNYLYLTGEVGHEQVLPRQLMLAARITGQVADSPLISNEQYAMGGAESVRGYHETEVLGDDGVGLSFELRSPNLAGDKHDWMHQLQLLSFVDGARVWIKSPLPDTPASLDLASVGFGIRFESQRYFVADLDWAYPLLETEEVDRGDQRLHLKVNYAF